MPAKLIKRRANDGLTAAQAARRLDVPSSDTKPREVSLKFFNEEERARRNLMSTVAAIIRADSLSCDVHESTVPGNVAVWEKRGRVAIYKSCVS